MSRAAAAGAERTWRAGPAGHEVRASALLGEFGKEHGPPFLKRRELGPELLQLAVDPLQLGPRLLFPEVSLHHAGC